MPYLGVDIGSISVKTAWIDENGSVIDRSYRRHYGKPAEVALEMLRRETAAHPDLKNIAFTGSGGKKLAKALDAPFENEIVCQSRAAAHLTPGASALIVVGGEDSFFIALHEGGSGDSALIRDFAMNGICAAGCGSFLDQQASRLGINIEDEFGRLAGESQRPARVAGRCSVFAKSDMIHLQQKATPVCDIVSGLCFAFARNFTAVLAKGKEFRPPVVFHGGVASNSGMVRAFREVLGMDDEEFIVPEHAPVAGAIGAALLARKSGIRTQAIEISPDLPLTPSETEGGGVPESPELGSRSGDVQALAGDRDSPELSSGLPLPSLPDPGPPPPSRVHNLQDGENVDVYLGVDVGSISTNVVAMDSQKRLLAKCYLMTAGRPIEAVRQGLREVGAKLADRVNVRGVCTTGSGRYLTGDFIGADLVKNEITAQARAAAEIDPGVDTIFEIGGQDSKYISLENRAIVDFEMNKVCAAGTGSFLEEQAEKLGISIKGEFADLALSAQRPVRLGERCTVFMESDLVGQQSRGASIPDLAAGLAYSTVYNYINRVVGERRIGNHIFFQGGTAFNRAVVSAFSQVTGKTVTVPEHHEVTGAIGCCLLAMENARDGVPSAFKGWEVSEREYRQESFECKACSNACEINRVLMDGEKPLVYGGRCEKYEKKRVDVSHIPDLFAEREAMTFDGYEEGTRQAGKPFVGIPRALHFADWAPFWIAFFKSLDIPIKISGPTTKRVINDGLEAVLAEYCFPVKVAHGHAVELMNSDITHLFMPCVLQLPKLKDSFRESVHCPYVSTLAYTVGAALRPETRGVEILSPGVDMSDFSQRSVAKLHSQISGLGVTRSQVRDAIEAGRAAQKAFGEKAVARGREILDALRPDERAVVIVSRGYNGCDNGVNLEIPTRFRELGVTPIPLDMIPMDDVDISDEFGDVSWRSGQKILTSAEILRKDDRLQAVYITNFGCGPDSFLLKFFRSRMGGKSFLQIEIDEHSADAGALTRCEAFLDSLKKGGKARKAGKMPPPRDTAKACAEGGSGRQTRTLYLPQMGDLAHVIAAAFRSVGVKSEVLPASDSESVAIGKKHCTGKECFPCIVTTGDLVRFVSRDDVDTSDVAFFMPSMSGSGGCRFGCYNLLHRMVLDDLGCEDVPVFSPNQSHGFYDSLGARAGKAFVRRAWLGLLAVEHLEKATHHVRPQESEPGRAQSIYESYLEKLVATVEKNGDTVSLMRQARTAFEAIPTAQDGRPWIGIVGEVFVRSHGFSNQELVRKVEEMGGKAWLAPLSEWLTYVNHGQKTSARENGHLLEYLRISMVDKVMRDDERRMASIWHGFLPNAEELPPEELIALGRDYIDPQFFGEPILSLGKSRHLKSLGLAGVINVMPFTCMLGTITSGLMKRFQQDYGDMPVLNLAFDGQEASDLTLRLEAFLEQCRSLSANRLGLT